MLYKEKPGFLARMNDVLVSGVDDSIIVNFVDHIWETGSHFGTKWEKNGSILHLLAIHVLIILVHF